MNPQQGVPVIGSAFIALAYTVAVAGVGAWTLRGVLGRDRASELTALGPVFAATWAFTVGQGVVAALWMLIGLFGRLSPEGVWALVLGGDLAAAHGLARYIGRQRSAGPPQGRLPLAWRVCAVALAVLSILGVWGSLLPTRNDDALHSYLVMAQLIAHEGRVTFQAANAPTYGLFPLGQPMHWAALLLVGNTTAVGVFDAAGSAATLAAAAALAAAFGLEARGQVLAPIFLATTPAFATLVGSLKVDNAAAAFGILAFATLARLGVTGGGFLSGLLLGAALASRYTDAVLLPAWLLCLLRWSPGEWRLAGRAWVAAASGLALTGALPLLKNWILVRQPLAPLIGSIGDLWAYAYPWRLEPENLSWSDVPLIPFVWTFGDRPQMLGTLSPLFLGLLPAAYLLRRSPTVRSAATAGIIGAGTLAISFALQPRNVLTRRHLVALALVAVYLAAVFLSLVDSFRDGRRPWVPWLPLLPLLALSLSAAAWRSVQASVYGAGRKTIARHYARSPGFAVAQWLNAAVGDAERVALSRFHGHRAFLRADILARSESHEELQAAWRQHPGGPSAVLTTPDWEQVLRRGFRFVVAPTWSAAASRASWPPSAGAAPQLAYTDATDAVLLLPPPNPSDHRLRARAPALPIGSAGR